jgi:DNA (cytosine-5)-methyltransferase 1
MRCLDMFTGIGGMALALRGYVKPLLYCELDEPCRAVLSERMRAGDIDRAPIHCDARTLFAAHLEPDAVVGGFPCQDISSMGNTSGVDGTRSSLFFELVRIIDESPTIECVFLENVANIVHCGIEAVLHELESRGFVVHWTTRSADEHGAPHVRTRWFALAHRGAGAARCAALVADAGAEPEPAWPAEPVDRCAMRPHVASDELYDVHWARRCRMLGNALVPCVARAAFEYLARSAAVVGPLRLVAPLLGCAVGEQPRPFPRDATLIAGVVCTHHRAHAAAPCAVDTSVGAGADLVHVPTPRHGNVYGGPPSERNLRSTLGVFLVNCEASTARAIERGASADAPMHKQIVPSPEYVEWMMGFPANWTRVAAAQTEPARSSRPDAEGAAPVARAPAQQGVERVFRRNGMHVLMRERSLGVRAASAVWREFSPAERAVYSERARHE